MFNFLRKVRLTLAFTGSASLDIFKILLSSLVAVIKKKQETRQRNKTGSLLGLPLKSKNQMNLITHELLAFTQTLGHEAVQYYCDNEPTARQIVRLLVSSRTAMGLKTTMRTTKLYDSAGNSLAENAVQRVRGLAASMMESLAEKISLRF